MAPDPSASTRRARPNPGRPAARLFYTNDFPPRTHEPEPPNRSTFFAQTNSDAARPNPSAARHGAFCRDRPCGIGVPGRHRGRQEGEPALGGITTVRVWPGTCSRWHGGPAPQSPHPIVARGIGFYNGRIEDG